MNILMALSQLEVTGAEVYAVTLSDELIKKGNKVWIVSDTLTKNTDAQYIKLEFNKRRNLIQRYKQVKDLIKIIKEKDIQVIHAHSRASSWSANLASKICGIPMITTVHGRQPVHMSRKIIKGFGDYVLPVCENIKNHIMEDLGVKEKNIKVLRNPINEKKYIFTKIDNIVSEKPIVSIIGRLSGPKGDVAYNLLLELYKNDKVQTQIVGGKEIPEKFKKFKDKIKFLGYVDNIPEIIKKSHVVIGAGRVVVESILSGRATIAIGEAELVGEVTKNNIDYALATNFGDIGETTQTNFDYSKINKMVDNALNLYFNEKNQEELFKMREILVKEFGKKNIVNIVEKIYEKSYVLKKKKEMPIIMYHRVIDGKEDEKGVHGTYILKKDFEEQLEYLVKNNYETLTFKDLKGEKYKERFNRGKKKIILTFDDGYEDNYRNVFPLLKKYNCKAVIYIMGEGTYNKWDVDHKHNPETRFNLMNDEMIKEMHSSGLVEFGVHTMTHPRLDTLSPEKIRYEIGESKRIIEEKLGEETVSFAYPYGDFSEEVKEITKEFNFEFVVATDNGPLTFSEDMLEIRRIGLFSTNKLFNFKRKVSGKYNFIRLKRELKREKKKGSC
ncbi:MAG: polysaccharide deacetylase family protein [Fusobacteriaceae bacterium]